MKGLRAVVKREMSIELEEFEVEPKNIGENEILIKTRYTMISPGTELAVYTGIAPGVHDPKSWCHYPFIPGYAGTGEVIAVGNRVERFREGDIVYGFLTHSSLCQYNVREKLCLHIPKGLSEEQVLLARFAGIGLTAVRLSSIDPGDCVLIIGLGLIGNFAAQLFREAGAFVVGTDLIPMRRKLVEEIGIRTIKPDFSRDELLEVTEGLEPRIVVDAVGDSRIVAKAINLVRSEGEVIILGTPRTSFVTDVTPLFRKIHFEWITVKGALEWCFPQYDTKGSRYSYESNTKYIWRLMEKGRLKTDKLVTHRVKPEMIKEAYEGLLNKKDKYLGVVINWLNSDQ